MSSHSRWEDVAQQSFLFFGTISAAISHEIRNKLAVVNERAGMLEDLAQMIGDGRPIDPERLAAQAHSIKRQVRQANEIVGNLNRFAHSADRPYHRCDGAELVALMIELCARQASTAGVHLALTRPPEPVTLTTSPFLLENLVFLCVELALSCVDEGRAVDVGIEKAAGGMRVRFCGLGLIDDRLRVLTDRAGAASLLAAVHAAVRTAEDGSELILEVEDRGDIETRSWT